MCLLAQIHHVLPLHRQVTLMWKRYELRALIRRISIENSLWGAPRFHGELLKLGFELAQSSFIERLGDIVADLVRLQVDVIVTVSTPTAQAAKAVTSIVPIVMATSADPVGDGIVQSLARPGGNITGLSLAIGPEIEAKRLELLGEMLPGVSRVAFLSSKEDWESPSGKSVRTAAQALGMTLVLAEHTPNQYTDAFTLISRTRSEALFVSWGPTSFVNRGLIVEFATRERLPSTFFFREPVELGGLMA